MSDKELFHYGVKGMKWGVRKKTPRRTIRTARKDAKEYARAKMFYGEGAGTRRKLIKATVKQRSVDPSYRHEFDKALEDQDMAKHAVKARSERRRKDITNQTKKTARGTVNILTGHPERLGAAMAGAYAVFKIGKKMGVNRIIANNAKDTFSKVINSPQVKNGARWVRDRF